MAVVAVPATTRSAGDAVLECQRQPPGLHFAQVLGTESLESSGWFGGFIKSMDAEERRR